MYLPCPDPHNEHSSTHKILSFYSYPLQHFFWRKEEIISWNPSPYCTHGHNKIVSCHQNRSQLCSGNTCRKYGAINNTTWEYSLTHLIYMYMWKSTHGSGVSYEHPMINPLLINISMHFLHTVLYTFPKVLIRRICSTIKSFFGWWSFPLLSWP